MLALALVVLVPALVPILVLIPALVLSLVPALSITVDHGRSQRSRTDKGLQELRRRPHREGADAHTSPTHSRVQSTAGLRHTTSTSSTRGQLVPVALVMLPVLAALALLLVPQV